MTKTELLKIVNTYPITDRIKLVENILATIRQEQEVLSTVNEHSDSATNKVVSSKKTDTGTGDDYIFDELFGM